MKIKKIYNDVYRELFVFVIQEKDGEVLKKYGFDIGVQDGKAISTNECMLILVGQEDTVDSIHHECYHAVEFLWDERGIDKIPGKDECFAYMQSWLFKRCYDFFMKHASN